MELVGRQADQKRDVCAYTRTPFAQRTVQLVQAGLRLSVLAVGLIYGSSASAIGLGTLHVKSALSHPLQAQLDLISPTDADLESKCYRVTINSLDGAQLAKVAVEVKADGPTPALILSTTQSIDEPAFALSVVYSCSSSSHRDYQVLLDLAPATPVVEVPRSATTTSAPSAPVKQSSDGTPQFTVDTNLPNPDAPVKKSRRHHNASSNNTEVVPSTAYNAAPPLASNESTELRHKKQGTKKFRNVLRLSDDDNVDTSLDDNEGMHLRVSRGLFGSNAAEPPTQSATPVVATPAATPSALGANDQSAQPAAPVAAPAIDPNLQILQAKIRLLEAQTEELRKLNAIQQAKLDAAQVAKSDRSQLLSLYFLLFLSFIAIVWLVWRMRQIESDITDSQWHHIVPETHGEEPSSPANVQTRVAQNDDDDSFLDEPRKPDVTNVKPLKPQPKLVAVDRMDMPFDGDDDTEPVAPALMTNEPRPKSDGTGHEYKFNAPAKAALPDAEEILDEIQQAEFWMEMHQPERAIEILESNWGGDRPTSPLPWLYLLDLYRQVNDRDKYEDLTARFEHIFNGKVGRWDDKGELDAARNLEDFPAVLNKIIQLWPTPDIVPYMENLLIDDRDGRRQGFELSAYRDILFLTNIAYAVQGEGESKAAHTAPEWSLLN